MGAIGVTLDTHTEFLAGSQVLAIVRHLEELGFESVWLTDTIGREPFVLASALLSATRKIRVGTGIASMYGRDAMAAGQTRRTLSGLIPGLFAAGRAAVGISHTTTFSGLTIADTIFSGRRAAKSVLDGALMRARFFKCQS